MPEDNFFRKRNENASDTQFIQFEQNAVPVIEKDLYSFGRSWANGATIC